jgi:hypothetical protein
MKKRLPIHINTEQFFVIGGVLLTVAIIGIAMVAFKEAKGTAAVATYGATDQERPQVKVAVNMKDFGEIAVSDVKTAEFVLENSGNKPLEVYGVTSSCGCTFGEIEIGGIKSQQFSMHAKSDWIGVVVQGSKAIVRVIYKPSLMPVKGEVTRMVYVKTNDPNNPELTFSVKATVK